MYKYGTSYYKLEGEKRLPVSGLDVRLIRPGSAWQSGLQLTEVEPRSGYYETDEFGEDVCGLYEIWDTRYDQNGSFSGKTCIIGPLDALGLQKDAVTRDAILDEAVSENKLESGAISSKQLTPSCVCLSNLSAEVQCETDGRGETTGRTPATIGSDKYAVHSLEETYDVEPLVLLIPMCDLTLFIGEVSLAHGVVKVTVGLGSKGTATALKYRLVAIRN